MVLATGRAPHLTSFGAVVVGGGVLVLMNFSAFVCCFPEFRFPPLLLLELGNDFSGITSIGYAAFTRLLCNSSSIMSTYQSNHTLTRLCDRSCLKNLPEDLRFLLQLNEKNSVSQAARLKIIKTHFSGSEINMQPFISMDLCVRPHAIAWMVRDVNAFHLLRALPMLLENNVVSQVNLK